MAATIAGGVQHLIGPEPPRGQSPPNPQIPVGRCGLAVAVAEESLTLEFLLKSALGRNVPNWFHS